MDLKQAPQPDTHFESLDALIRNLIAKDIMVRTLPDIVKDKAVADLSIISLRAVLNAAAQTLNEEKKEEFNTLASLPDKGRRDAFLKTNIPNFNEVASAVIGEQLNRFKAALSGTPQ